VDNGDKVKILVPARNDMYGDGQEAADADGNTIAIPPEFPPGTVGYVDLTIGDDTLVVGVFHNDDREFGPRLGNAVVKANQVERLG